MMNSDELVGLLGACPSLKHCKKIVTCSSALKSLTLDRSRATVIIANTDMCTGVGIHWVAMFIPKQFKAKHTIPIIEFFDSLGRKSHEYNMYFSRFLSLNCKQIRNNCVKLQSNNTRICGGWCVNYLARRAKGETMNNYVRSFSGNLYKNDEAISKFMCNKLNFRKNLLE